MKLLKTAALIGVGVCSLVVLGCDDMQYANYSSPPPVVRVYDSGSNASYGPPRVYNRTETHYVVPAPNTSGASYGPPPAPANNSSASYGPPPAPANNSSASYGPPPAPANNSSASYGPPPAPANNSGASYGPAPAPVVHASGMPNGDAIKRSIAAKVVGSR